MNSFSSDSLIQELVNTPTNLTCFDCNTQDNSQTSLNNGIFLCQECSQIHRGFGINISQVRPIQADEWTEHDINFLKFGGNQAFREYLSKYEFASDVTIEQKYRSVAAVFYRKKLKQRVDTNDQAWIEEPPSKQEGVQILDLHQFQEVQQEQDPKEILLQKEEDDLDKIKKFFVGAYSKTEEGVKKFAKKIEDTNFKQEFKDFGIKVQNRSQQLSQSVSEKYKIAAEKSKLAAEKTKVVASGISEKSKETFEKAKIVSQEGYVSLKKNIGTAWGILKQKVSSLKENKENIENSSNNTVVSDNKLNQDQKTVLQ